MLYIDPNDPLKQQKIMAAMQRGQPYTVAPPQMSPVTQTGGMQSPFAQAMRQQSAGIEPQMSPDFSQSSESQLAAYQAQDFKPQEKRLGRQEDMGMSLLTQRAPDSTIRAGNVVAPNISGGLRSGLEKLAGGYMLRKTREKQEELDAQRRLQAEAIGERSVREDAKEQERRNEEAAADLAASRQGEVFVDANGANPRRGYMENGKAYNEDGTQMPPDYMPAPAATKSVGTGGRMHMSTIQDPYGNDVLTRTDPYDKNAVPEYFMINEDGEPTWTPDRAAAFASISTDVGAERAGAVKQAQQDVVDNNKVIENLTETIPGIRRTADLYAEGAQAIAAGARTGPLEGRAPTIRTASAWLDNVQQQLGLEKIGQYTFGSLSEAEGQWVRESSIPQNIDEKYLGPYLVKKAEGAQRMVRAAEFERAYREKFKKRPPDDAVKAILYEGGFTFDDPDEWFKK